MQTTSQTPTLNAVEAIWALIQCQKKSVQRALAKRFQALDAEKQSDKCRTDAIKPELQVRLDAARQDIINGHGTLCRTKEELQSFLAEL